jgi:hypothetical protein
VRELRQLLPDCGDCALAEFGFEIRSCLSARRLVGSRDGRHLCNARITVFASGGARHHCSANWRGFVGTRTTAMRSFRSTDGVPSRSGALSLHADPNGPSTGECRQSGLRDLHIVLRRIEARSNGVDNLAIDDDRKAALHLCEALRRDRRNAAMVDRPRQRATSLLPAAALAGVGARKAARIVSASRFTPAQARAIEGKNELLAANRDKPRPLVSLDSRE